MTCLGYLSGLFSMWPFCYIFLGLFFTLLSLIFQHILLSVYLAFLFDLLTHFIGSLLWIFQHILLSPSLMLLCDSLAHFTWSVSLMFLCDFLAHFIGSPPPSPWISVYLLQKLPAEPLEYKQYSFPTSCIIICYSNHQDKYQYSNHVTNTSRWSINSTASLPPVS